MSAVDVSVIVITYNRAAMLREAMESVLAVRAEGFTFEIVVVDNASTDNTRQTVEEIAAASTRPVRYAYETREGVPAARNRGVAEAKGEWIAFFDDDQLADPNWLAALVGFARERSLRCVGGAVKLQLPEGIDRNLAPPCREILSETIGRPRPQQYNRWLPGTGNALVRRDVFDQVGMFNETLVGGGSDSELFSRIRDAGFAIWYTPEAVIWHRIPASRLSDAYFRWTATRRGCSVVLRDVRERGRAMLPAIAAARAGHSCLVVGPRIAWAWLRRDREAMLGHKCRWWRNEGYLRGMLAELMPRTFAQEGFFKSLKHRAQRTKFSSEGSA